MKMFFLLIVPLFFVGSCKKKDTPTDVPHTPLEFTSFTVEPDILEPGALAAVKAIAKGEKLNYQWAASHGDLFGSGANVTYGAPPCCTGENVIYCTVSDGRTSIKKEVVVLVKNPD